MSDENEKPNLRLIPNDVQESPPLEMDYADEAQSVVSLVNEINKFQGQQKLKTIRHLVQVPDAEGRLLLEKLYASHSLTNVKGQGTNLKIWATLVNAILSDKLGTFLLSESLLYRLLSDEVNCSPVRRSKKTGPKKTVSGKEYKNFMAFAKDKGLLELIYMPSRETKNMASVFTVRDPVVVRILARCLGGEEVLDHQRKRVLEYAARGDSAIECSRDASQVSSVLPSTINPQNSHNLQDFHKSQKHQDGSESSGVLNKEHHFLNAEEKTLTRSEDRSWTELLYGVYKAEGSSSGDGELICEPIRIKIQDEISAYFMQEFHRRGLVYRRDIFALALENQIGFEQEELRVFSEDALLGVVARLYYDTLLTFWEDIRIKSDTMGIAEKVGKASELAKKTGVFPVMAFEGVVRAHFEFLKSGSFSRRPRVDPTRFEGPGWSDDFVRECNSNGAKYSHAENQFIQTIRSKVVTSQISFFNCYREIYSFVISQEDEDH